MKHTVNSALDGMEQRVAAYNVAFNKTDPTILRSTFEFPADECEPGHGLVTFAKTTQLTKSVDNVATDKSFRARNQNLQNESSLELQCAVCAPDSGITPRFVQSAFSRVQSAAKKAAPSLRFLFLPPMHAKKSGGECKSPPRSSILAS
jgi:hypothetical protein